MKRAFLFGLTAMCCCLGTGCSFVAPKTQTFSVMAEPATAKISLDGRTISSGRSLEVERGKDLTVLVTAPGFYPESRRIGRTLSKSGIIDGIAGCIFLFPWLGLISDGAWELEKDHLYVELQKRE